MEKDITKLREYDLLELLGVVKNYDEIKGLTPRCLELGKILICSDSYIRVLRVQLERLGLIEPTEERVNKFQHYNFRITEKGQMCLDEDKIIEEE